MTRRDYEFTASIIRDLPADTRLAVAQHFAMRYGAENHGFKPDRFLKACGVRPGAA